MSMVRCDANEHYYDDSKHSSCPFCGNRRGNDDKTSLVQASRDNADKTKLVAAIEKDKMKDDIVIQNDMEKTVAPWQKKKVQKENLTDSSEVNISNYSDAPVVGWLVIVDGNLKGQDFRIIPGINTIGRDSSNTILINTGDSEISREKHCIIEFDVKNSKFYLERGTTTTYLNEGRVGGDGSELKIGDIIELGATKLKFIPFCSSEFCWDM